MVVRMKARRAPAADEEAWAGLMLSAQRGDAAAYRQLLTAITPYVRIIARHYVRRPDEVEDTVQDILLSLHSIRHTYEPGRPFLPWLATIAVRRAIDRYRAEARFWDHEVALNPEHETFISADPKNETAGLEAAELRHAIEQLSAGQRKAITLLKLQEMSLEEASSLTGLSVTALKVATHRAVKSLKSLIEKKKQP